MDGCSPEIILKCFRKCLIDFPTNTWEKNAFLSVCKSIKDDVKLHAVNSDFIHGGKIGPGNSRLHDLMKRCKVMQYHAIFHDAFGYMKHKYDVGPGYIYATPYEGLQSTMYFGHITGLFYWLVCCLTESDLYYVFD